MIKIMANLIVDTDKLNDSGQDILRLTKELNEEFNAMFTRISNISSNTMEWVGTSANDFIRRANIEKIQYAKLINTLNKYGNHLLVAADKYQNDIKNIG